MKANKAPKKLGRDPDAPTNVAPKIIRTRDELAALDPDALVAMNPITKGHATAYVWSADTALRVNLLHHAPLVVLVSGDHVRAARRALEADQ